MCIMCNNEANINHIFRNHFKNLCTNVMKQRLDLLGEKRIKDLSFIIYTRAASGKHKYKTKRCRAAYRNA